MEKKYQVFISSTFEDLKIERQAAIGCLLDMQCIPVGMEQFPASPLSQWEYITRMIDMSDYYILIIAGRYGSLDSEGNISYTEKEYQYAKNNGIPILAFLYKDITQLPSEKKEKSEELQKKLLHFRDKVQADGLIDFYSSPEELKYEIARAIRQVVSDVSASGWVRVDQIENLLDQTKIEWHPNSYDEIGQSFVTNEYIPVLSDEAKELLKEVSQDPSGQILQLNTLSGLIIQTNNKTMNSEMRGKEAIIWQDALAELKEKRLVNEKGTKHQVFQITRRGYNVAEGM